MAEPIKISEEDLKKVQEIQTKYQEKVLEFGNLYLEKMGIDRAIKSVADREEKLQEEWEGLQKSEAEFIDDLLKRYGEGNLDLKNGVFIPAS